MDFSQTSTPHGLMSGRTHGLRGTADVPGDASISHRSVILSSLAQGRTRLHGLLENEDVLRTARAVIAMGVAITPPDQRGGIWEINGCGNAGLKAPRTTLHLGNSRTSARLLAGVAGGYPLQAPFTGDTALSQRPMGRVIRPLSLMGVRFEATSGDRLPLRVIGQSPLRAIDYTLPVASAQVKSAILIAALRTSGTTTVTEPAPSRDHTERMFQAFGVRIDHDIRDDGTTVTSMQGGQTLASPADIHVPGDPGAAAFITVAALITPDSDVLIRNVAVNPLRMGVYTTLKEMGGDITFENPRTVSGEDVADLRVRSSMLSGVTVPPARSTGMIDDIAILAIAAACASGETVMTQLGELRLKDDDRLSAIANGLLACGVDVLADEDSLTIRPTGKPPAGGATIRTRLDHRIGISFLVLGMVTTAPIAIDAAETIATRFPGFADVMNRLGGRMTAPVA